MTKKNQSKYIIICLLNNIIIYILNNKNIIPKKHIHKKTINSLIYQLPSKLQLETIFKLSAMRSISFAFRNPHSVTINSDELGHEAPTY